MTPSSSSLRRLGLVAVALGVVLTGADHAMAQVVYTVTTTADTGTGSLRQALLDANAHSNQGAPDSIFFSIPGVGVHTIQPLSELPASTQAVVVDGTTQPGASCDTWPPTLLIELDGSLSGATASDALRLGMASAVRGLVINRFSGAAFVETGTIRCNFVGTDATGTLPRPNGYGVYFFTELGGPLATDRNLISGNTAFGVYATGSEGGGAVRGNYIGTDATGLLPLGNREGIYMNDGGFTTIGGTRPGEGNVIAGNRQGGIALSGGGHFPIQGNRIGVGADGVTPVPNLRYGILASATTDVQIGGATETAGNVIAHNSGPGVVVYSTPGVSIRRNLVGENVGPGIDLAGDGPTANDPGDPDTGANRLQNTPEITAATGDGTTLSLTYRIPSAVTNSTYPLTVEFYLADAAGTAGWTYLGTDTYTADEAEQVATFSSVPPVGFPGGSLIVATATDAAGNTSEFSAAATALGGVANEPGVAAAAGLTLTAAPDPFQGETTLTLTLRQPGPVRIEAFDVLGRRVAVLDEGPLPAGAHPIPFSAANLPAGSYLLRAVGPDGTALRRVTALR